MLSLSLSLSLSHLNSHSFFPKMGFHSFSSLLLLLLLLLSFPSPLHSQQPYINLAFNDCSKTDNSTTVLGYLCNGISTYCSSYLIFRSQPPFQSINNISALLGSDPSQLSLANSVPVDAVLQTNTMVLVPVNCSCSGGYYQFNASHLVQPEETSFIIANNSYQGLSTCQAIDKQNGISASGTNLLSGSTIRVPLRCACPTRAQIDGGVKYLLGYLVEEGDVAASISQRFSVDSQSVLAANELSFEKSTIYPSSTLLIPLKDQPNVLQTVMPPPSPPPPAPSASSPMSNGRKVTTGAYVGIGFAAASVVLIATVLIFVVFRRKARKEKVEHVISGYDHKMFDNFTEKASSDAPEDVLFGIVGIGRALKEYKYAELQLATKNFSKECRIDGSVYCGVFNGDVAAVKMLNRDVKKEIDLLKKINHSNLIGLSGICFHQGRWFVVYEYAENGSLSEWLFDKSGSKVLSWIQRVQIALDVAHGLNYLHNYIEPSYVHKDIKCSNILLDGKFKAKVANLGLARSAEDEEDEPVLTKHIVGTQGYMAPEYLEHGLITPKLDVYAFGVVMMEMVTGKEAVFARREVEAFSRGALTEDLRKFIDPFLEVNYPLDMVVVMARLISGCLGQNPERRPRMMDIVQSLSGVLANSTTWAFSNATAGSQFFQQ